MNITVDADWWQTLFDDVYLLTDARSVCDNELTSREMDAFCAQVPMQPDDRILDLCGGHGRHSLELARRGFRHCVVMDYSQALVDKGRAQAARSGLPVRFVQGDARRTALEADAFDHVLILGNSMGYLPGEDADLEIFAECRRLLKPGGWLLVDVTDGRVVKERFSPTAWHEIGEDIVVCREREMNGDVICVREMVLSKTDGMVRDRTYRVRLYGQRAMQHLVAAAGFSDVAIHREFAPHSRAGDYGCMNHRMLVTARNPAVT